MNRSVTTRGPEVRPCSYPAHTLLTSCSYPACSHPAHSRSSCLSNFSGSQQSHLPPTSNSKCKWKGSSSSVPSSVVSALCPGSPPPLPPSNPPRLSSRFPQPFLIACASMLPGRTVKKRMNRMEPNGTEWNRMEPNEPNRTEWINAIHELPNP